MDFLVGILDSNINYNSIVIVLCSYMFLLWIMVVSVWIGFDARKRYHSLVFGFGFFLLVLILNLPALLFYFIVRPERDDDNVLYLQSEESSNGVNVPIVNFKGEDGFVISLQLKIGNPKRDLEKSDMNINVEFETNSEDMQKREHNEFNEKKQARAISEKDKIDNIIITSKSKGKNVVIKVKNDLRKLSQKLKAYSSRIEKNEEMDENSNVENSSKIKSDKEKKK